MGESPLPRIKDFIHQVVPFDTLGGDYLTRVISRMEIVYFPRGEVIIRAGDAPAKYLHIIKSGSVKISLTDDSGGEMLIDVRGEGDCFGAVSLLQGAKALFDVTAREDVIALLLPAEHFRQLVETFPSFKRHFSFSLARNIQASQRANPAPDSLFGLNPCQGLDAVLGRSLAAELMTTAVLTCAPQTSIRQACRMMTAKRLGSILVRDQAGAPLGILTDADLRERVLAAGLDADSPVSQAMSQPVHTVAAKDYAFEAMLKMIRHRVHHLAVTEGERLVGVLSDHDLRVITGAAPVGVLRDLDKIVSVDELELIHQRIDPALEMLLRLGGSAAYMLELATEFNDSLTAKILDLTQREMEQEGLGRAPAPFAWLALGSSGRREQALRTHQMNGLVYADVPKRRQDKTQRWFLTLGERAVERLAQAGFPTSTDGLMASQPSWCQSLGAWRETFLRLIEEREHCVTPHSGPLFDFRCLHAAVDFDEPLRALIHDAQADNRQFLPRLGRLAPGELPPLGFLRDMVVDKRGQYQDRLDLKLSGLLPVVRVTRVLALEQGIRATSTLERLAELVQRGVLTERFGGELREAFGFITLLRIARHLGSRAAGREPDSHIDPASLSAVQRKMLKESFAVISQLQEFLEQRCRPLMVA